MASQPIRARVIIELYYKAMYELNFDSADSHVTEQRGFAKDKCYNYTEY
jgi:hypothetical protein